MKSKFLTIILSFCAILSSSNVKAQSDLGGEVGNDVFIVMENSKQNGNFASVDVRAGLTDHLTLDSEFSGQCSVLKNSDAARRSAAVNNALNEFVNGAIATLKGDCRISRGKVQEVAKALYQCPSSSTAVSTTGRYEAKLTLTMECLPQAFCVGCEPGTPDCVRQDKKVTLVYPTQGGMFSVEPGFANIRDLKEFVSAAITQTRGMAFSDLKKNVAAECESLRASSPSIVCDLLSGVGHDTSAIKDQFSNRFVEVLDSAYGFVKSSTTVTTYCKQSGRPY